MVFPEVSGDGPKPRNLDGIPALATDLWSREPAWDRPARISTQGGVSAGSWFPAAGGAIGPAEVATAHGDARCARVDDKRMISRMAPVRRSGGRRRAVPTVSRLGWRAERPAGAEHPMSEPAGADRWQGRD